MREEALSNQHRQWDRQPKANQRLTQAFLAGRHGLIMLAIFLAGSSCFAGLSFGQAQPGGFAHRPYLGWSTYSEQTIVPSSSVMNEQNIHRIIISGEGNEPYPDFSVYEAENAVLSGSASAGFCGNCSCLASVGNLGGSPLSTVTFDAVNVPVAGTYQMEIDYMTQGQRSFFVSVNGGAETELDLNGYSFGTPTNTVIQVPLHAGSNEIQFSNPDNYAPNLDSITIGPVIAQTNQTAAVVGQTTGSK
jgi:hypothetical protein